MWIEPPPLPPREPPVPKPLQSDAAPKLIECGVEGILRAPELDPRLYYVEAEKLWYRYWRRRWYQAFNWDGYWFPPEHVPEGLKDGPPGAPPLELPELPELEEPETRSVDPP
jgi:hypothetical protein